MDKKIIKWLAGNKSNFAHISSAYGVSIPTLYKIANVKEGEVVKIQQRIKTAVTTAYVGRSK